jgi:biopolymer transport protein TolR
MAVGRYLPGKRKRQIAEMNVVPYIDVMLVLLIIFMVTSSVIQQGVDVDLPKTSASPVTPPPGTEPLIVTVMRDGGVKLDVGEQAGQPIAPEKLAAIVAAVITHKPETPVLVAGHEQVDYGAVVRVMALLRQAGVPKVGLMTDPSGAVPAAKPR